MLKRPNYDSVVLAAPVTIPYVRYSTKAAHWWVAQALAETLKTAAIKPRDIWRDVYAINRKALRA